MREKFLVTTEEMKQFDENTITLLKLPAAVLMERAALSVVQELKKRFGALQKKRILVLCGGGNNGGDGMAVARLLLEEGISPEVAVLVPQEKFSADTALQWEILQAYNPKVNPNFKASEYDIVIDALLGTGCSRAPEGILAAWIRSVNASGAFVVAVDIPSGVCGTSGRAYEPAVKAELTITFGFAKRGLYLYPGKAYAGQVICTAIGITEQSLCGKNPRGRILEGSPWNCFPERCQGGNKGTFGKVLVVAGGARVCGAALLCAQAVLRSGAGMVKVFTHEKNRETLQRMLPEAMLETYGGDTETFTEGPVHRLEAALVWADCVVAGPGIGQSETARNLCGLILEKAAGKLVFDADALNLLAKDASLRQLAKDRIRRFPEAELVLTPHQGELARLLQKPIEELKQDPVCYAVELSREFHCITVSKDAVTVTCDSTGRFYLNTTGNNGMATAGSGDVLAGLLGSFFARRDPGQKEDQNETLPVKLAAVAVYLHGSLGDLGSGRLGKNALLAGDLIEELKIISSQTAK